MFFLFADEISEISGGAVEAFSGGGDGDFDWQYLQGALVLLGAAGRCQRCFAGVEEVRYYTVRYGTVVGCGMECSVVWCCGCLAGDRRRTRGTVQLWDECSMEYSMEWYYSCTARGRRRRRGTGWYGTVQLWDAVRNVVWYGMDLQLYCSGPPA